MMREMILLAPGANESELRRAMARYGKPSLGLRIMNGPQLARHALMKAGMAVPEAILGPEEEMALVSEALSGNDYFRQIGLSDIRNVASTLREIRQIAVDEDREEAEIVKESLVKGPFQEKNAALLQVYEKYIALPRERKLTDGISLMRKAVAVAGALSADILTVSEFPLSPLEDRMARTLSGGTLKTSSLIKLFGKTEQAVRIEAFRACYGIRAEAETVLSEIRDNGYPLDRCLVAVSDARSYSQLFFEMNLMYRIPVSFGCGIPLVNAAPAELLRLYTNWATTGFFGKKALEEMLFSEVFDRSRLPESVRENLKKSAARGERTFLSVLGGLRLTNKPDVNAQRMADFKNALTDDDPEKLFVPALMDMAEELSLSPEAFIRKYARLRPLSDAFPGSLLHRLDAAALSEITRQLTIARLTGQEEDLNGLTAQIFTANVLRESSRAGALHLCGIEEALNVLREHLYVMGLSAGLYPGTPRENHLLLDADIMAFPPALAERTSAGKIRRKQTAFRQLLHLASALGSQILLSYPEYDAAQLKSANASSLLYEAYAEAVPSADFDAFTGALEHIGYFDHSLREDREIGRAVTRGAKALASPQDSEDPADPPQLGLDTAYSPSALSTFYECPRRFYLRQLLGIPEPEEEKPFEIMPQNEMGTLAHTLMEQLGAASLSKDDFITKAANAFDSYISKNPPLTTHGLPREREDFLQMMALAYDQDASSPRAGILLEEEDIRAVHAASGIRLHGFPDRVEMDDKQQAIVVDFKTAAHNDFVENDIDSCLQAVVYAYLMESHLEKQDVSVQVQGGEYRLLRLGENVAFTYDDAMKAALEDKLKMLRSALEDGRFDPPDFSGKGGEEKERETCKYCHFGSICGKESREEEEDDEP